MKESSRRIAWFRRCTAERGRRPLNLPTEPGKLTPRIVHSRRELISIPALAMLSALGAAAFAQAPGQRSSGGGVAPLPASGQSFPVPEEVILLDGTRLRPVHQRGDVLVLYWWASWCPFCAIQSPMLDKLWRARRDGGLQMLGLSIDKKREEAIAHVQAKGYAFASTWVTPEIERVMPRPKGLPVTLVLGRDGKVLMAEAGQLFAEDIDEISRYL